MQTTRSPARITLSVWKALFLRESLARLFSSRGAWFWLLMEPVLHVAFLMLIFGVIRVHTVGGIDMASWIMLGLLGFFMFRRTGSQVMNAVNANQALFTYRQVKPVDTAIVRGAVEGFLTMWVVALLLIGHALFADATPPSDPLGVLYAFGGLWLFGIGFGLVFSVAGELVPELGRVVSLTMTPLYFASGVMFPLDAVPMPYREWLLLNPIAHGVEAARLGFVAHYHAATGLSLPYLYAWALGTIFIGLALHRRFALRLATQ